MKYALYTTYKYEKLQIVGLTLRFDHRTDLMGAFDELNKKLHKLEFIVPRERLLLTEDERERLSREALEMINNGVVIKLKKLNVKYFGPDIVRQHKSSAASIRDLLKDLLPSNGHAVKEKREKKRKSSIPKTQQSVEKPKDAPKVVVGLDAIIESSKPSNGKKAEASVKQKPKRKSLPSRKIVIEPEPFSREVFFIRSHDELALLRRKHFVERLNLAREIARSSEFINVEYSIRDVKSSGLSKGPLDEFLDINIKDFGDSGRLVAMIYDKRSVNGGFVITLEDETGALEAFLPNDVYPSRKYSFSMPDGSPMSAGDLIIPDEPVYVYLERSRSGRRVIKEIHRPGEILSNIVANRGGIRNDRDFSVIFLSDTHIGSKHSIAHKLKRLREWLRNPRSAPEAYKDTLSRAELILVGGDLVDGIGVFPGQENELEIKDPEKQYERFAEIFSDSPLEIIAIPGNHDPTTTIVPQPVPEYAMVLKEYGIKITQNPARIEYDGFRVFMYHGRSMEDLVLYTPIQLQDVNQLMKRLALSNFYAPIYGGKEAFRPDPHDPLAIVRSIKEYPHVFVMGHIHIAAYDKFGSMYLINGGTTQTMPEEKVMNIEPTPGEFVALDLKTRSPLRISIL